MPLIEDSPTTLYQPLTNLRKIPQLQCLSDAHIHEMELVARVLPFRTNNYVVEELIDWSNVPEDPIFQLTFPQPGMLSQEHRERIASAVKRESDQRVIQSVANQIRQELNPHPAGQLQHNVPSLSGQTVPGVQHKYRETCLVFPSPGQTCHAYCSFCFRWAQFVGINELKLATDEAMRFGAYLRSHKEITDVLFTGGDPLVMKTEVLQRYVEPLLEPEFNHIQNIRLGTKAITYWPFRFVTQPDADDLLRTFERIVDSGKHLAIMAHVNHVSELQTPIVEEAIRRVRSTGAVIRTQSPIVRHINDDANAWVEMWERQVQLGCVPYYMFIERQTGARQYFTVPLYKALHVYRTASQRVSGLARSARGPVMSALPGKVQIQGVSACNGSTAFVLSFLQAREPSWCHRPFFAEFRTDAEWLTDLKPAFGKREFFFEKKLSRMLNVSTEGAAEASLNEATV